MKHLDFSFLFFSDVRPDVSDSERYHFMQTMVQFADRGPFKAVYFPERHFHEFGSIYANPALLAAWLIPQTQKIRFRTAGISLPLHHPAEIVEWWATNDIISGGRIDLGFGSGWNKHDFILAPEQYSTRKECLHTMIEQVQRLWRGETLHFKGPDQTDTPVRTFPVPIQPELTIWLLVTQNNEAFEFAGRAGYNVFTMLYGYDFEELSKKIRLYRLARQAAGLDPKTGVVTLMMHTLIMPDNNEVHNKVEAPLKTYIKSAFTAHQKSSALLRPEVDEETQQKVIDYAFHRYLKTSSLLGDLPHCLKIVEIAHATDLDEIAFLVDFGVDYQTVLRSLSHLTQLVNLFREPGFI